MSSSESARGGGKIPALLLGCCSQTKQNPKPCSRSLSWRSILSGRRVHPGQDRWLKLFAANPALQSLQSPFELGVFRRQGIYFYRLFDRAPLQRLCRYHQDPGDVPGVECRWRPNGPHAVVAKGGKEILGHAAIVAELFGVMADVIPTREVKSPNFFKRLFSIHRLEVFFSFFFGGEGKGHLAFDDRNSKIAHSNFIARIDDGAGTNGRGVG